MEGTAAWREYCAIVTQKVEGGVEGGKAEEGDRESCVT